MSSRTKLCSFVKRSAFVAALLAGTALRFDAELFAQGAPAANPVQFAKLEPKLKTAKEVNDRRKDKSKAISAKAEKPDLAPVELFYKDFLRPQLSQPAAEMINQARAEFLQDMVSVQANPALVRAYNDSLIAMMGELLRPKDKANFSPQTRINALIILSKLNSSVTKDNVGTPDAAIQSTLLALIDQNEIDALSSLSLSTLYRHLGAKVVNDNAKKAFVAKIKAFLDAPVPPQRSLDANNYMIGQAIDCLTRIASTDLDKDPSKQATQVLSPMLVKLIDKESSEWLLETACLSLGTITPTNLTEEDIAKVEYGLAKYARRSLKEWKNRIWMSNGAAGGMGYGGMGAGMGMGMGGEGGFPGGEGSGGDGYGGGFGQGGKQNEPKKALYDAQPKEVKNARRIAHQRFERIHVALNGSPGVSRKPSDIKPGDAASAALAAVPVIPPADLKGLIKLMPDGPKKDNVQKLIDMVAAFQMELNDEKIKELGSLITSVGKSMKGIREICVEIMGEDPTIVVDDESAKIFGTQ